MRRTSSHTRWGQHPSSLPVCAAGYITCTTHQIQWYDIICVHQECIARSVGKTRAPTKPDGSLTCSGAVLRFLPISIYCSSRSFLSPTLYHTTNDLVSKDWYKASLGFVRHACISRILCAFAYMYTINKSLHSTIIALSAIDNTLWSGVVLLGHAC